MELLEQILSRDNLNLAFKKVVSNKGAAGVDKVTVEEIFEYLKFGAKVHFGIKRISRGSFVLLICTIFLSN